MSKIELKDEEDYPFRPSLTKKARCGMCEHFSGLRGMKCSKGHEPKGPFIANIHDCKDYKFKQDVIRYPKEGNFFMFMGEMKKLPECDDCSFLFEERCDGIGWYPFETNSPKNDGKCEFFRSKKKICKHAVPYLQYGSECGRHHRNNYCSLPPEQRDGDQKRGWRWNCSIAHHDNAEYKKCYVPKGD